MGASLVDRHSDKASSYSFGIGRVRQSANAQPNETPPMLDQYIGEIPSK
jgi:hypothetical protein